MATKAELRGYGSNNRYEDTNDDVDELIDNDDELLMITPSRDNVDDNLDDYLYDEEGEDLQYDIGQEEDVRVQEEDLSDNELNILQQLEEEEANGQTDGNEDLEGDGGNGRIYQSKLCKPVVEIGKTKIGMSQAKLFGLLDAQGNVKISGSGGGVDRNNQQKKFLSMSKPREIDPDLIDNAVEKPSFKPSRTKEALNAMKNPKCGYDFVNRMKDDNSDFLDRVDRGAHRKGNYSKAELDTMEADYAIKQDKLQCPQCKKPQSFDEFIEKKRNCSQCNKKFDKLNVTSGVNFAAKAQEKEAERRAKLRAQEVAMYGEKSVSYALPRTKPTASPPLPPPDKNASNSKFIRENILKIQQQQQQQAKKLPPIGDESGRPESGDGYGSKKASKKLSMDADKMLINKEQGGLPWINMVEKIAVQNSDNNALLNATLVNLQQQYGAYVEDGPNNQNSNLKSAKPPRSGSAGKSGGRPKSASATGKSTPKDKTTMKFEKLLDVDDGTFE